MQVLYCVILECLVNVFGKSVSLYQQKKQHCKRNANEFKIVIFTFSFCQTYFLKYIYFTKCQYIRDLIQVYFFDLICPIVWSIEWMVKWLNTRAIMILIKCIQVNWEVDGSSPGWYFSIFIFVHFPTNIHPCHILLVSYSPHRVHQSLFYFFYLSLIASCNQLFKVIEYVNIYVCFLLQSWTVCLYWYSSL